MTTTNLGQASKEWANRPADERFSSVKDLYLHSILTADASHEATESLNKAQVIVGDNGDLQLETKHEGRLAMSHWAFTQLCGNIGSNARYMRSLVDEPERAAYNMNEDIAKLDPTNNLLYIQSIGQPKIVSATSEAYGRLHNYKVAQMLMDVGGNWRPLPAAPAKAGMAGVHPATAEEIGLSSRMKVGDPCITAGIYASADDMFIFQIDDSLRVDDGSDGGLSIGYFAVNSEVGKRAFDLKLFMFREVCQNHIVWDAEDIQTIHIKHLGNNVEGRVRTAIETQLKTFGRIDLRKAEHRIQRAKNLLLGGNFDEVSDNLFSRKELGLSRRDIKTAYQVAEMHVDTDGNPRSAYGFVNGITRMSQNTAWADAREKLDQSAARVLKLADLTA